MSVTDDAGKFAIPLPSAAGTLALYVRRIGFAPTRVAPITGAETYAVQLRALAVSLPEVTVHAGPACPILDDPRARRVWEKARSHYQPLPADRAVTASLGGTVSDHVPEDSVGVYDPARAWSGGWVGNMRRSEVGLERFRTEGYAHRAQPGLRVGEDRGLWGYAQLESREASHFAEDVFGELHDFSFIEESPEIIRLRFCPRGRSHRPEILGTLTFGRDTTFAAADWRFTTPAPEENAGGQAFFAPVAETDSLLLPTRTVYWRRVGRGGRYYQRIWDFREWATKPRLDPRN